MISSHTFAFARFGLHLNACKASLRTNQLKGGQG